MDALAVPAVTEAVARVPQAAAPDGTARPPC